MSQREFYQIVPAQPGWFVAILIERSEDPTDKVPYLYADQAIVAWEIRRWIEDRGSGDEWSHHVVTPITLYGILQGLKNRWCIKGPDYYSSADGGWRVDTDKDAIEALLEGEP